MNPSDTNLADNRLDTHVHHNALRGAKHYACHSSPRESYVIFFTQYGACSQWPTTIYSTGQGRVPVPFQCTKLISVWFSLC